MATSPGGSLRWYFTTVGGWAEGDSWCGERGCSSTTASIASAPRAVPTPQVLGLFVADDIEMGHIADAPALHVLQGLVRLDTAAGQLIESGWRSADREPPSGFRQ